MDLKNIFCSIFIVIIIIIASQVSFSKKHKQINMNHPEKIMEWSEQLIIETRNNCSEMIEDEYSIGGCSFWDSSGIFRALVESETPGRYMVHGGWLEAEL